MSLENPGATTPAPMATTRLQPLGQRIEQGVFGGLLLMLVWVPLPFGSHRPWAEALFTLVAFSLLALWCLGALLSGIRTTALKGGAGWVVLPGLLWLGWGIAQTLPWPAQWITQFAPLRGQQVQLAADLVGTGVAARIVPSLDAELTRAAVRLSAGYAVFFMLLLLCLRRRHRFQWLLWTLLASGVFQALYGGLMVLSGLEYGAWGAKEAYRGSATGTFVNRNHLAGYLEIALGVALGLMVVSRSRSKPVSGWRQRLRRWLALLQDGRLLARAGMAVLFIGLMLSQSRMGNVAGVAGVAVAGLAYQVFQPRQDLWRWTLLLGGILVVDIWLFGHWFGLDQLASRYAEADPAADARFQVFRDLRNMIPAYWKTGSGLGTFMLAYPGFRSSAVVGFYDQAHNDYAQFLIEAGIVGFCSLAFVVVATLVRAVLILYRRRDPIAQGTAVAALAAMTAIAVHSTVDFNLQIPANALTLLSLMAAVMATETRPTSKSS